MRKNQWTKKEDKILIKCFPIMKTTTIIKEKLPKRSIKAVRKRAHDFNLKKIK